VAKITAEQLAALGRTLSTVDHMAEQVGKTLEPGDPMNAFIFSVTSALNGLGALVERLADA
jgi:hypothetical protein